MRHILSPRSLIIHSNERNINCDFIGKVDFRILFLFLLTFQSWDLLNYKTNADFIGHTGYISCITLSPDGSLCASAGKDGVIILWDLNTYKTLYTLNANSEVHALAFSPNRYWLAAATTSGIKIFKLQERTLLDELKPEFSVGTKAKDPEAISLAWSADGQNLFAGYTDNKIRVWQVMTSSA